jgi:hypothetical protein
MRRNQIWRRAVRSINDQIIAALNNAIRLDHCPPRCRRFLHGNAANFVARMACHIISTDTLVDNGVIVSDDIVVNDGAVFIDVYRAICWDNMFGNSPITESAGRHKRVVLVSQSKAEIETNVAPPVTEAKPGTHM